MFMNTDPITDFVNALELKGAVFLRAEFTAPWAIIAHVNQEDCRPFMPVPRRVIAYHIVLEGEAQVSLGDRPDRQTFKRVRPGDVLFLPTNSVHTLASAPGVRPIPDANLIQPPGQDGLLRIKYGGGGERMRMICGFMASDAAPLAVLDSLPELLIVNIESLETRTWIENSATMAARELSAGRMSGSAMVAGVARLMLIEALRELAERNAAPAGWLSGMAHPQISRVLAHIHKDIAAPLRVEELAAVAGMSRSSFAERFTDVVGIGARRYILLRRMEKAAFLLRDTDVPVSEIACRVGYDATEAFSRAFKRQMGTAPLDWRHADASAA